MDDLAALKAGSRKTWAAGDYDAVSVMILGVGPSIVARTGVGPGDEVLDVACGTGNAAIPAASAGARVTGVDLTPELFDAGRARAAAAGVGVEWTEGDAEALPFPDASFDVVLSTFGAMFAPRHDVSARELARVLRPGGRLGLCNWTPEGGIGTFFKTVAKHVPPPPGGEPPLLWGTEAHCRKIFAGTGVELTFDREAVEFRFPSAEVAVELYTTKFGPVVMATERLRAEGRFDAFRAEFAEMFTSHDTGGGAGEIVYPGEYLVVSGRKSD